MNTSPELLCGSAKSAGSMASIYLFCNHTNRLQQKLTNWFVVGKKAHIKLEICANWVRTEPTKCFFCCAFVCRIYSRAEVRTRAESRAKFGPRLYSLVHELNTSRRLLYVRPVKGKCRMPVRKFIVMSRENISKVHAPSRCPLVIRGLSKHLSIRMGGRLMTNSR